MKRELLLFCLMSSAAAIGAQTTINGVTYNAGWVTACDKGMTEVVIEPSVNGVSTRVIADRAFSGCNALVTVDIPSSVTEIHNRAFSGCTALREITCGESNLCNVDLLDEYVFSGCTSLQSVPQFDASVRMVVGNSAFSGCTSLKQVRFSYIDSFGDNAFYNCSSLESVWYGRVYPVDNRVIGRNAFSGCAALKEFTIPANVVKINDGAFANCVGLKQMNVDIATPPACEGTPFRGVNVGKVYLKVADSMMDAYKSAPVWSDFCFDPALLVTKINGITYEDGMVTACDGDVTDAVVEGFADGKKTVGIAEGAFDDCVELMSVKLPVSVTEIGARAFSGCLALKTVVCDNPILGGACFVVSVGEYAFSGCGSLESVPAFAADKPVSFGQYAFSGCGSLQEVSLRSIEHFAPYMFSECLSMTSFAIPAETVSVGECAFAGCSGLTEMTSAAVEPPVCDLHAFEGVDLSAVTLTVGKESLEAYRQAEVWKDFHYEMTGLECVRTVDAGESATGAVYDMQGRRVPTPLPGGVYIVGGRKTLVK